MLIMLQKLNVDFHAAKSRVIFFTRWNISRVNKIEPVLFLFFLSPSAALWTRKNQEYARSHQGKFVEVDLHKNLFLSEYSSCFI